MVGPVPVEGIRSYQAAALALMRLIDKLHLLLQKD